MKPLHLVLFFTRNVSLRTWAQNGSLEREIALYRCLQQEGIRVSFITYGNKADLRFRDQLQDIEILCNRWNLPLGWYERLIPLLHARTLSDASLIKTNQTRGAEVALRVARVWHKPLIARCGYMWSDLAAHSDRHLEAERARSIEGKVFPSARRVVVTTPLMKEYIIRHYNLSPAQVWVIPNFVLTDVFVPDDSQSVPNRICFVGRFDQDKNLPALIRACAGLSVELYLIGDGQLRSALRDLAKQLNVKVQMPGNLPHHELPNLLRSAALFVLVSPHEGHPKSLLEAMACGVSVMGADSPGIREQIVHGETGWLCGTDPESIRAAIQHLLANPGLRHQLGLNARKYIVANYSLERIVEQELRLIKEIVTL
ncbi:MAG TPA: glycosyltransferase family 4 protein [Anaerolineales bacterium]|nr:glycosyltransferase family 4 protein [Anaerolineales bacterium]